MDLTRYFSVRLNGRRNQTNQDPGGDEDQVKRSLPLLASPINENAHEVLRNHSSDLERANVNKSAEGSLGTTSFAASGRSSGNLIIYKEHHEASTIELFYDLYFVANLAYFTAVHQHTDAESLFNYLKLFTMLWFNWLCTTLFDVRFSIDSVWNRAHKTIQFGVFTGFVFAGPVFDKYNNSMDATAYRNFAIVLTVSRIAIAIQYAMVMWQGRMFKQTLVPLALNTGVHLLAAVGYGITIATFPRGAVGIEEQITWVAISIAEGLAVFLIAIIWRIVSFKYTHLVERLQLLTLIIIGEGIIGMVKSVSCITKGQTSLSANEVGTVAAAVILLYLLHSLYFDVFSSDHFGTVRQQLWSLLHYPLHMAILLCVEGNTSLIVWNSAAQALKWIWTLEPASYSAPAAGFENSTAYLAALNTSMWAINSRFTKSWATAYNWNRNLTSIANYTDTHGFASDAWNDATAPLVKDMYTHAQVFVFEAHADTLGKLAAVSAPAASRAATLRAVFDVHNVTVLQFYGAGGAALVVLAVMYWFNKRHKTKYEFGEIMNRVVVGFGLVVLGVAMVLGDTSTEGIKFRASQVLIPLVVVGFAIVLILDNTLLALSRAASRKSPPSPPPFDPSRISSPPTTPPNTSSSDLSARYTHPYPSVMPYALPRAAASHISIGGMEQQGRRDTVHVRSGEAGGFSYENTPVEMVGRGEGGTGAVR